MVAGLWLCCLLQGPWCICMWAFARMFAQHPDFIDMLECDATNRWVVENYSLNTPAQGKALAAVCESPAALLLSPPTLQRSRADCSCELSYPGGDGLHGSVLSDSNICHERQAGSVVWRRLRPPPRCVRSAPRQHRCTRRSPPLAWRAPAGGGYRRRRAARAQMPAEGIGNGVLVCWFN